MLVRRAAARGGSSTGAVSGMVSIGVGKPVAPAALGAFLAGCLKGEGMLLKECFEAFRKPFAELLH